MRISDIVMQIRNVFPRYSDVLSNVLALDSIVVSSGVATVTTSSPHGLLTGAPVILQNFSLRTPIDGVSEAAFFYFSTSIDHDLTEGWYDVVTLDGFTDPDWNDSFTLMAVPNRTNFGVSSDLGVPTLSGNEVLLEDRIDGVNGYYAATVTGTNTFTISGSFVDGDYSNGTLTANVRAAGAIDVNRVYEQYTKQTIPDVWCFVLPSDVDISKDLNTHSDATMTNLTGDSFRLRMLDRFIVLFVKNTTQDMAAIEAIDLFRHDLLYPILKTICGVRFDSGLSDSTSFKTVLRSHGVANYNRAYLAYAYDFELPVDIVNDDIVQNTDTRAFRDIEYSQAVGGPDTQLVTASINLDDNPLFVI